MKCAYFVEGFRASIDYFFNYYSHITCLYRTLSLQYGYSTHPHHTAYGDGFFYGFVVTHLRQLSTG